MYSTNSLDRRDFIKLAGAATAGSFLTRSFAAPDIQTTRGEDTRPNLLFLHVDQLSYAAISAHGDPFVNTPNLDKFAEQGFNFSKSYSPDPICCPARSCWVTGRYSSEHNVVVNNRPLREELPDYGQWMGQNGYQTVHIGKWHVGRPLHESFQLIPHNTHPQGEYGDNLTALSFESFLTSRNDKRPFFANIGLMNPHDCGNSGRNAQHPFPYRDMLDELPTLPANFDYDLREPEHLKTIHKQSLGMTKAWQEENWRYASWLYYRLVEMVDVNVGYILDTLERSPYHKNTMIILTSDHGDNNTHHRMFFKNNFYDRSVRVPMMVAFPGQLETGIKDDTHLVSGLDIFPTLCDYAEIEAPVVQRGASLRPLLEQADAPWRKEVFAQSNAAGRMVVDEQYKFVRYSDSIVTQLFDLENDPLETKNLSFDSDHQPTCKRLSQAIDTLESTLDNVELPEHMLKGKS